MIRYKGLQTGAIYDELNQLVAAALERLQLCQGAQIQDFHFVLTHLQLGQVLSRERETIVRLCIMPAIRLLDSYVVIAY